MLKILIIDDDMLTRKGIQMLMPWEKHDMKIVGESANGQEALEFLKEHPVDLALVDLDMPVMDGMTFIETASRLYPELNYVVLTVHTEFEYIQNVLRAGAIDYIAKTQFDKENFDQILDRISSAIHKKSGSSSSLKCKECRILYPDIFALISLESENEDSLVNFLEQNRLADQKELYELLPGVWVFYSEQSSFLFPDSFANSMLLHIHDVAEMTYAELGKLLRSYVKGSFFYDYRPIQGINEKHAYELQETVTLHGQESIETLKKEWLSLNWVHENALFDQIRFDLKNSKLKPSSLYHLLLALENVWNSSYSELTGNQIHVPPVFHSWDEVENWLLDVYEKTNYFQADSRYSSSVARSILNIKNYVDNHLSETMDSSQIARNANMSYGYFSRCFHDMIGVSFSDYCAQKRIASAKELLKNTNKTIQEIAFQTGYNDEKYFSRSFKKLTGMSPSEYRKTL